MLFKYLFFQFLWINNMYNQDCINLVVKMYKNTNFSIRELAKILDIPKSNISRWILTYDNPKPPKLSKINDNVGIILKYIQNSLKQNPFRTLSDFKHRILKKFQKYIGISTLSKYMKIIGYSKKKIGVRNTRSDTKEIKKKQKEFVKRLKKIPIKDILCLDESYINAKIYSNYG